MTALTGTASGVVLIPDTYTNPITIDTGVTVSNTGTAIYGTTNAWTIENSGYVHGYLQVDDDDGYGIVLMAGGDVTNACTGTIVAQGTAGVGVLIDGGAGTLLNHGRISSDNDAVWFGSGGYVTNAVDGYISGGGVGVYIQGGTGTVVNAGTIRSTGPVAGVALKDGGSVINEAGGLITGLGGVYLGGEIANLSNAGIVHGQLYGVFANYGQSEIYNQGVISSTALDNDSIGIIATTLAVDLQIINSTYGIIEAAGIAIQLAGDDSTIVNDGLIFSPFAPAIIGYETAGDLQIINDATGTIEGGALGIIVYGEASTITNQGLITALNDEPGIGILVGDSATGTRIDNQCGGTIFGQAGIVLSNTFGTVVNNGLIVGGIFGDCDYSVGIFGESSASDLTVTNAADGAIAGATGIILGGADSTVVNSGTITSFGGYGAYGGILAYAYAECPIITNSGLIEAVVVGVGLDAGMGTVTNSGSIISSTTSFGAGVAVWSNANDTDIVNQCGATISGYSGIYVAGDDVSISNCGTLIGTGGSYYSAGIYVVASADNVYVTNCADGTISGYYGLYLGGSSATIVNAGVIHGAGGYYAAGISVGNGVDDAQISNASSGTISGDCGIFIGGTDATITNAGVIAGNGYAPAAGIFTGASSAYTTISNELGGTISGSMGVYLRGTGDTVLNAGLITTAGEDQYIGIYVAPYAADAFISNAASGTISGAQIGIHGGADDMSVVNAGAITGIYANAYATDLHILNQLTGSIYAATGISVNGANTTITNQGNITGLACYSNAGIYAGTQASGLVILNQSYGTISGYDGIILNAEDVTIANLGLITSAGWDPNYGIVAGTAATGLVINNESSGLIAGYETGIYADGANTTIINSGSISGDEAFGIVLNGANSSIENDPVGTIIGENGIYFGGAGSTLDNSSVITGTERYGVVAEQDVSIVNEGLGTISGSTSGVVLFGGGTVANYGSITGGTGIALYGTGDTITNAGLISGCRGIYVGDSASGVSILNQQSAVIGGAVGIDASGNGSIVNLGLIFGFYAGIVGDGQVSVDNQAGGQIIGGYDGISMQSASITNEAGAYIFGYDGSGVVLQGDGAVLDNAGLIVGGSGDGVESSANITITNEAGATIVGDETGIYLGGGGTLTNAGIIHGDNDTAVSFGTVSGHLIIAAGAVFDGLVDGGTALSSMELTTGSGDGTLSGLGDSFTNFDSVTVDAGATWFLEGANTLASGSTLDNEGTLIIGDGATLSGDVAVINDGTITIDPTTVLVASVTGTGTVNIEAGATLTIGDTVSAGETLAFDRDGSPALLEIGTSADMLGTVAGFGVGDIIDVADLAFVSGSTTATVSGDRLTLTDGSASVSFATSGLVDGTRILALSDGNGGTNLFYAGLPAIDDPSLAYASDTGVLGDGITADNTPEIDGTGIAGDTITLYDGETVVGTTTVGLDGSWAITTSVLADGLHGLSAVETDNAFGASPVAYVRALTIDTAAPDAPAALALDPSSDSGLPDDDNTDVATPVITGTGEIGALVTLYDGETIVGTATVGLDGTWSVTADTLSAGLHALTATQTDQAGNVSGNSGALELTIDYVASPDGLTLAPQSDSGTLLDDVTLDITPTITGTAAEGDTVTLYEGETVLGTAVADEDGNWSITSSALAEGQHDLTATATDPASNVSTVSDALSLLIDTSAPDAPTLDQTASLTDTAAPVLFGFAEVGSIVSLYQDNSLVGTAMATGEGWSFTYADALAPGDYVLTATATDPAGNVSSLSSGLVVQVREDSSYEIVKPIENSDNEAHFIYDSDGALVQVDTTTDTQEVLTSVTDATALINIYDTDGNLIGTIRQPSNSPLTQPSFTTTPDTQSAQSAGSDGSNVVDLLSETNVFVSVGNDDITVHSGTAIITARGPTTVVHNMDASLVFNGESGSTTVDGGNGSATIVGGSAGGTLVGGTLGNNLLAAGGGNTLLVGGGNGDVLFGSANGVDTMLAGPGQEILVAGGGTTTMTLNDGDLAFGGTGQSTMFGGAGGGDIMIGGTGDVVMVANGGDNVMCAGLGNSTIWAGSGQDILFGGNNGESMAFLNGGTGNDVFLAGPGTVSATGGTGNDIFWTGSGTMTITEGGGNDTVVAGSGNTTVTGGAGPDLYVLNNGGGGGNLVINDFKVGVDQVAYFGYDTGPSESVVGGNTVLTFTDHTTITLIDITHLAPGSLV